MPLRPAALKKIFQVFLLSLIIGAPLPACKEKRAPRLIDRSFYYWKSSLGLGATVQKTLVDLKVNRIYVKFFDVAWNESKNAPAPIAILDIPASQSLQSYQVIPTVFITNDCITKINDSQVAELAKRIISLIKNITLSNNIKSAGEIQLDCDWTAGSKEKYFHLLQTIKDLVSAENKILSATVRLYQYKYFKKTGVPPVDRGLLMCYNMGNLKNPDTRNSILEPQELQKYIAGLTTYSLPLDIALPIFSWKVLFRDQRYTGLINGLPTSLLRSNPAIKISGNKFNVLSDVTINGYDFQPGDMIRDEEITYEEIIKAESILTKKLKTQHLSVVLYHLDSITLTKFTTHELETIFDYLH